MAVWLQAKVRGRGLGLRHIGCTLTPVCDTQRRFSCSMLVAL